MGFGDVSVLDLAMLIDVKWYFIVILIFISLIACDVEYTFISPLVICICSLHIQRCLLRSLVHFVNWVFCFLSVVFFFFFFLLCFKYFLYILDKSPLSDVFLKIFSKFVNCVLILFMLSFAEKFPILTEIEIQLIKYLFYGLCLCCW